MKRRRRAFSTTRYRHKYKKRKKSHVLFTIFMVVLISAAVFFLNQQVVSTYTFSRFEGIRNSIEEKRAESFASNLSSPPENTISAEGIDWVQAIFSLDDLNAPFALNAQERMYPASMTKIMTALLLLRDGDLDAEVVVGQEAVFSQGGLALAGVLPGDRITRRDLLYAIMLPSGNDAANTIAVEVAGSVEVFAQQMTEEARRLGATKTTFLNPSGLHEEGQHTTAYDLYIIFRALMEYEDFIDVISTAFHTAEYVNSDNEAVRRTWRNTNAYLTNPDYVPEGFHIIGGKTGTTNEAGLCLILLSENQENNRRYISVVAGAANRDDLYTKMSQMISNMRNR